MLVTRLSARPTVIEADYVINVRASPGLCIKYHTSTESRSSHNQNETPTSGIWTTWVHPQRHTVRVLVAYVSITG